MSFPVLLIGTCTFNYPILTNLTMLSWSSAKMAFTASSAEEEATGGFNPIPPRVCPSSCYGATHFHTSKMVDTDQSNFMLVGWVWWGDRIWWKPLLPSLSLLEPDLPISASSCPITSPLHFTSSLPLHWTARAKLLWWVLVPPFSALLKVLMCLWHIYDKRVLLVLPAVAALGLGCKFP